eukprot:12647166-Ditylum_brightwellii.AAC.1
MKTTSVQPAESFHIKDPEGIDNMVGQIAGDRYKTILKAKYEKANLKKEVEDNCPQLNLNQQLKLGATPYHSKPYSIHQAYKQQL